MDYEKLWKELKDDIYDARGNYARFSPVNPQDASRIYFDVLNTMQKLERKQKTNRSTEEIGAGR